METYGGHLGGLQLVKHLSLNFCSRHNLRIVRCSPALGSALRVESAWDSLSFLSLCNPPLKTTDTMGHCSDIILWKRIYSKAYLY